MLTNRQKYVESSAGNRGQRLWNLLSFTDGRTRKLSSRLFILLNEDLNLEPGGFEFKSYQSTFFINECTAKTQEKEAAKDGGVRKRRRIWQVCKRREKSVAVFWVVGFAVSVRYLRILRTFTRMAEAIIRQVINCLDH